MNKKQLKKYSVVTTASFMTLQLAACGAPTSTTPTPQVEDTTKSVQKNTAEESNASKGENATADDKVISVKESEYSKSCAKWKENEDGSSQCIDENSPHYSQYFFNGLMFATLGAMAGNAMYKAKTEKRDRNGYGGAGGGGYSGGSNVGGNTSSTNGAVNNSGVVVPPANSKNNATNNSSGSILDKKDSNTNTSKSKSGIDLNKSNSTSGKTESNSASKGNSSSNSGKSSYSSGKSGFSSGGASRGGSASS